LRPRPQCKQTSALLLLLASQPWQTHHDEAKNAKGPGKCASDCECDGMRSCVSGKCSGKARPKKLTAETCNNTDYHYQESWTPAGAGTCSGDCEVADELDYALVVRAS
jgi:hypothetical protein